MLGEVNMGYKIIAVMPDARNDIDVYVTGEATGRAQNYVTWATTEQFGLAGCYAGRYSNTRPGALTDMVRRAGIAAEAYTGAS